jgi:hypothetical protein
MRTMEVEPLSRHVTFSKYLAKYPFSEPIVILIETDLGR